MKRLASVLLLSLFACGEPTTGAQTQAGASLRIGGIEPISMAVGSMGSCTVIGTNRPATGPGLYIGLTSAHCFPRQKLLCQNKIITWGNGKTAPKCVNVVGGAGEGSGDFVFLELDSIPGNIEEKRVASEVFQGDDLEIIGSDGKKVSDCKVTAIVGNTLQHNCLPAGSSGYSGSPLLSVRDGVKALVGIHVSQAPGIKTATPWMAHLTRAYQAAKARGSGDPQSDSYAINLCRKAFHDYLVDVVKVKDSLDEISFGNAAYAALQQDTFSKFVGSKYLASYYGDICKGYAAGSPLGAGLLRKGDAGCKEGSKDEDCGSVCCAVGVFKAKPGYEEICGDWKFNREKASPPMPVCRQQ
jgi:hypothetical protein